jgi:hypothetical protein
VLQLEAVGVALDHDVLEQAELALGHPDVRAGALQQVDDEAGGLLQPGALR